MNWWQRLYVWNIRRKGATYQARMNRQAETTRRRLQKRKDRWLPICEEVGHEWRPTMPGSMIMTCHRCWGSK